MAEVIGVRFKEVGKVYYFDPLDNKLSTGDKVIVETARGLECGEVAMPNKDIDEKELNHPLKPLVRIATKDDLRRVEENRKKEKSAHKICEEKIAKHKLVMKLVNVEYTFDNSKIIFYFTADGRVDFRALVKDLASVFRTRIELRQIGVRDEAKMLGGLGICGRPFCCSRFMGEFQPVSIKMAKEQGLSLSPTKISGTCGRLMCCLKYEQEHRPSPPHSKGRRCGQHSRGQGSCGRKQPYRAHAQGQARQHARRRSTQNLQGKAVQTDQRRLYQGRQEGTGKA